MNKAGALLLLQEKQAALHAKGEERLPQRSDFTQEEVVYIKAAFGAFPRALEAAGLKPPRPSDSEKRLQRRIAAKRRKTAAKLAARSTADSNKGEEPS